MGKKKMITLPKDAVKIAESLILDQHKEHFFCIALDARNQVRKSELVSMGTLNANLVHPRETFRPAIVRRAAGIIVIHNHPSGDASPSAADVELTKRLKKAGEILGIDLLDHVIFAPGGEIYSFRDQNEI